MLASIGQEFSINPFQALIETISAIDTRKQLERETNMSHGDLKICDLKSYITEFKLLMALLKPIF